MYTVVVVLKTGEVYTYGPFQTRDAAVAWRDENEMHLWETSNVAVHTPIR